MATVVGLAILGMLLVLWAGGWLGDGPPPAAQQATVEHD